MVLEQHELRALLDQKVKCLPENGSVRTAQRRPPPQAPVFLGHPPPHAGPCSQWCCLSLSLPASSRTGGAQSGPRPGLLHWNVCFLHDPTGQLTFVHTYSLLGWPEQNSPTPQLGDSNRHVLSHSSGGQSPTPRCRQGPVLLSLWRSSAAGSAQSLPQLWHPLRAEAPPRSPHAQGALPVSTSASTLPFSWDPRHPGRSHPLRRGSPNLTLPAMAPLPNTVMVQGPGC